jgi:L-threonylcarbamoyladenylate synthase
VALTVDAAARRLRSGAVVAFPTETVYGLGADAMNARAVVQIFALKGRPADHPVIVHLEEAGDLGRWAVDIPPAARVLAGRFWPGPLTMILLKAPNVPDAVTGGQDTVGLRVPAGIAHELLRAFNALGDRGGVAAPSANRFGHVSPTTAQHVREEFGPELEILDGGPCEVGLESTIVDLSRSEAVLLRPGGISRADLEAALGVKLLDRDAGAPRASGTLAAHYSPRTALRLVSREEIGAQAANPDVAVLAFGKPPQGVRARLWLAGDRQAERYGHALYANLRALDASGASRILVESPERTAAWEAINDRLDRAAAGGAPFDDGP